jgi:hypothetical protein
MFGQLHAAAQPLWASVAGRIEFTKVEARRIDNLSSKNRRLELLEASDWSKQYNFLPNSFGEMQLQETVEFVAATCRNGALPHPGIMIPERAVVDRPGQMCVRMEIVNLRP